MLRNLSDFYKVYFDEKKRQEQKELFENMRESYTGALTEKLLPTLKNFSQTTDTNKTLVLHTFYPIDQVSSIESPEVSPKGSDQTSDISPKGSDHTSEYGPLIMAQFHLLNKPNNEITRTTQKRWDDFASAPLAKCRHVAGYLAEELDAMPNELSTARAIISIGFQCRRNNAINSVDMVVGDYNMLRRRVSQRRIWWFLIG
jgi:hypothetical protein